MNNTIINCPICDNNKFHLWKKWKEKNHIFYISICKKCGFILQNPRIDYNVLNNFYEDFYYTRDECENKHITSIIEKEKNKANHIFDFIEESIPNKKKINILEIGCGYGNILSELDRKIKKNCYLCGVDLNNKIRLTNSNINFVNQDFCSINFDKKFDIIIVCHTLEHFYNPSLVSDKIFKILNDDGICYVECPNVETSAKKFSFFKKDFFKAPEHFSFFGKSSLSNLFNKFDIIKFEQSFEYGNFKSILKKCSKTKSIKQQNYLFVILKYIHQHLFHE